MNFSPRPTACRPNRTRSLLFGGIAGLLLGAGALAEGQNVQHLSITQAGGMPGWPLLTGIARTTNGVNITWDGPSGYYQLFKKESVAETKWGAVGKDTNFARQATLQITDSNAFFRVSGPGPSYAGAETCAQCHVATLDTYIHTLHAAAFTNTAFVHDGGQANPSCLACHTVGYGLPTGFVSLAKTPKLAGVQCENCHGPAGNHAANPGDPTLVPRAEIAATVCGGCHTTAQHPTYDEWNLSGHAKVITNLNAASEIDSCGRCHSGSVRLSLLQAQALPTGDAELGIECAVCHDPHQTNRFPAQLRNPLASTNDYFMPTNGTFAASYNPQINLCGQCHNHAGASWTNSAGAPHSSSQYNMLLGTVGELATGLVPYQPGAHATLLTNQCVDCHMQSTPYVSPAQAADTGHTFTVNRYDLCFKCHTEPQPLLQFTQESISNEVQQLKLDLDYWASKAGPPALWRKYGNRAWEFTTPGSLSPGGVGPDAAEQGQIPVNIQKARFNVYVVLSDGSLGVHNPEYAVGLLQAAEDWIAEELDQ